MTSLNAINLQVLSPVYSITSNRSISSTSTILSRDASHPSEQYSDVDLDNSDEDQDDEELEDRQCSDQLRDLESQGCYLNIPTTRRVLNNSSTTLVGQLAGGIQENGTTSPSSPASPYSDRKASSKDRSCWPYRSRHKTTEIDRDGGDNDSSKNKSNNDALKPKPSSLRTPTSTPTSTMSGNGIEHALKLNFLSTLGPGIPVTPTVSVFGDGLSGFINRNPSHPGGIFGYSPEEEQRLVNKIDWRIIPILGMIYFMSALLRSNLTNARMFALESAVNATNEQFTWAIAVFYIGYGLAEVPSMIALLRLSPKIWLPASMFVWGCISFSMAWAKALPMLFVARFVLGISEAALIPGVLIYISMFYKKSEQTFRMALLSMFNSIAGAVGGLLSGAIGHLDGQLFLHGWQWIFIIQSFPTMALAVAAYFLLTRSPESAPWLSRRESSIAIYRIRNDTKIKVTRHISKKNIVAAMTDPKVYVFMAIHLAMTVSVVSSIGVWTRAWMAIAKAAKDHPEVIPLNSTLSQPSLGEPLSLAGTLSENLTPKVESLLQEPTSAARVLAQLLSAPPYALGALTAFGFAVLADRTQQRGLIMVVLALISIVGYLMVLLTDNVYVNYAGTMVISMGQTPMTPILTSWFTTNLGGYAKRAVAVAMFLLSSSIGGVCGTQVYRRNDSPRYGHLINIGCLIIVIAFTLLQRWLLKRENNRRDFSVSFGVNPLKYLSKAELRDLNDKHPAFRYNL
ncbi:hypothetical protein BGZ94_009910 [Podila epigama]|nr:hypothetical protein BGZ94_009910 [Podila epigama]